MVRQFSLSGYVTTMLRAKIMSGEWKRIGLLSNDNALWVMDVCCQESGGAR